MKQFHKKIIGIILLFLAVITFSVILYLVGPETLVEKIGVHNSYGLMFLVALFAGFSAWTSSAFLLTLITLALGGINPIYLGLIAGGGLIIGDIFMLHLVSKGREVIKGKWDKRLEKIAKKIKNKRSNLIAFLSYIYIGLTPFPNDFLIIFLGLIKYPRKKIYLPIILGDLTFPLLVAILATKGIQLFV